MTYETKDVVQVIEHYQQLNQDLKEDLLVLEKEARHLRARTAIFQEIATDSDIVEAVQVEYAHYVQELTVVEQYLKDKQRAYETNEVIIGQLKQLIG